MTRNQIFGAGVGVVVLLMFIGSIFSDSDRNYRYEKHHGDSRNYVGGDLEIEIDTDIDGDEIVVKSIGGKTVVFTKDGKIECDGRDAIVIKRQDGSETRIEC